MMWAVMGIGMLINTIQGAKVQRHLNQQQQALQQQSKILQGEMDRTAESLKGRSEKPRATSISKGPNLSIHVEYPEQSYKNLNKLQSQNFKERTNVESKLRQEFGKLKENFFKENHYETEFGKQGKGRVVTTKDGKPRVKPGPETPPQQMVRQHHESATRLKLADLHGKQMDSMTQDEATKTKQFLADNLGLLSDAGVQQELQKMIVSSKKRSLKLQQDQDEERWKADMPPTKEIQEAVEIGLKDLRQLEQRHVESEIESPDHQAILDYEQEFAAAIAEEKTKIAATKPDESFLMDPRKMMQQAQSGQSRQPERFDEVLPGYLTANLFAMGIYEV